MELQQGMQRELLSNPDTLRQVMDNPMVRNLMNDPDTMRTLITANPQMQELIEVIQGVQVSRERKSATALLFLSLPKEKIS